MQLEFASLITGLLVLIVGAAMAAAKSWLLSALSVLLLISGAGLVMTAFPVTIPSDWILATLVVIFGAWSGQLIRHKESFVAVALGVIGAVVAIFAFFEVIEVSFFRWGVFEQGLGWIRTIVENAQQGYDSLR